jgi:hypothetical protein
MLVDVIGGDDDLRMPHQHFAQRAQLFPGVGDAGRIGRAVDHHQTGARRDRGLERLGGNLEALIDGARNDDRGGVGEEHHVRIRNPVGTRNDDFVARVEQRLGEIIEALLAADGNQDLTGAVVEAVVTAKLLGDRLAQRRDARHRGVTGEAGIDRIDGRLLDVLRRVEVGLACAKADDVLAFGAQLRCPRGDRQGRRRLDPLHPLRKFHATVLSGK